MNLGSVIILLKLLTESGALSLSPTPKGPSSEAGLRPNCGPGKKAILQKDQWVCVPTFD